MKICLVVAMLLMWIWTAIAVVRSPEQDDIWAVIEFPEGQEVALELAPTSTMPNAKGTARVSRNANGAEINLDITGLDAATETYHVFAIDSLGNASSLGTLTVTDGVATLRAQSALTAFMLVVSPKEDLVTLTAETPFVLRSTVPEGYKSVPRSTSPTATPESQKMSTESSPALVPDYEVPLLGVSSMKHGKATQMSARLFDQLQGARLNASVTPRAKGVTQVNLVFRDLKEAPESGHYIVWIVSPDNAYSVLGKAAPGKQAKVEGFTELSDFGLFVTIEDSESPMLPTGKMVAMIVR